MRVTEPGTRPTAANAEATFRRRSSRVSSRCLGEPRARTSSGSTAMSQLEARRWASSSAAWCPRRRRRSGSPGTNTRQVESGRTNVSTTTSAAQSARRRSPRSFQAATIRRTGSSYSTAARACANARRRPEHSAQRRTGHAVGAPQRSQPGGSIRRSAALQPTHTCPPGREQTRQRCGSRSSSTHRRYVRRCDVSVSAR
jgi:hypothetical protein